MTTVAVDIVTVVMYLIMIMPMLMKMFMLIFVKHIKKTSIGEINMFNKLNIISIVWKKNRFKNCQM